MRYLLLILVLLLAGCASQTELVRSENTDGSWTVKRLPDEFKDYSIYHITGTVASDVESLVRQTKPASGSMYGNPYFVTGYYSGAQFQGKGFIRLLIEETDAPIGKVGDIAILKVVDSKSVALLPGDQVSFKCRVQPEIIDAMFINETFTPDAVIFELDYCRLTLPLIKVK